MPSTLPEGDPVPVDGSLPDQAYSGSADRTLSIYLHVPFCATRCGYCDFNTYTAGELGTSASPDSWFAAAAAEIDLAATGDCAATATDAQVSTVFVGGGTPSLMGAEKLGALLARIQDTLGLHPDAEVTTEANPESTDAALAGRSARGRLHPSVAGNAVHRSRRPAGPGTHAHPRAAARRSSAGPGRPGSNTSIST